MEELERLIASLTAHIAAIDAQLAEFAADSPTCAGPRMGAYCAARRSALEAQRAELQAQLDAAEAELAGL